MVELASSNSTSGKNSPSRETEEGWLLALGTTGDGETLDVFLLRLATARETIS